jgi:hypothetical protein
MLKEWVHSENAVNKTDISIEQRQRELQAIYAKITKQYVEIKQDKIRQIKKELLDR